MPARTRIFARLKRVQEHISAVNAAGVARGHEGLARKVARLVVDLFNHPLALELTAWITQECERHILFPRRAPADIVQLST